ncbi:MAG: hypothetical protein IH608_12875 [Proteobacteria bacterium]|nr:hypothetical protein [Pseudomonadota bacterium]
MGQSGGGPPPAEGGLQDVPEPRRDPPPGQSAGGTKGQVAFLDAVQRAIAQETRRARDHLAALESFDARLAVQERLEEEENRLALGRIAGLSAELSFADPTGRQFTEIYYQILGRLREERERLGAHLEAWGERSPMPIFSPELSLNPLDIPQFQAPLRALREVLDRVRTEEAELHRQEQALRVRAVNHTAERVRSLHRLRIACVRKMEFGGWGKVLRDPREALAPSSRFSSSTDSWGATSCGGAGKPCARWPASPASSPRWARSPTP